MIDTRVTDGIGRLVLNEPPLNIITRKMMESLRDALTELAADTNVRVLLVGAEGKHFSAGADVGEHLPPEHEELIPEFVATIAALYEFPLPTIGAVRGRCLGGAFELVQALDMVVAGESASLGQPEIMLGVLPPAAGVMLPRMTTRAAAAEIVFSGDAYSANQALQSGLVLRVVRDEELEEAAESLAARIARHSRAALLLAKRLLRHGAAGSVVAGLETARRIYVDELMHTEDALEGLRAFGEKRHPEWKHS